MMRDCTKLCEGHVRDKAANADNSLVRVRTCCVQAIATKCIHLSEPALVYSGKAFLASGSAALGTSGCSESKCQELSRPNGNHAIARSPSTRQLTCTPLRYVDVRQDVCLPCLQLRSLSLPRIPKSALRLCEQRLRELDKSRGSQSGMWDGFETIAVFGTALGLRRFL